MKIDTLTKNFSNYQTQINKDNDLVSNVHSDNVVKIQISDEARSLSQTNSKNEKEYEIKVSQEKIENHKDQNSIQNSKGGVNPIFAKKLHLFEDLDNLKPYKPHLHFLYKIF